MTEADHTTAPGNDDTNTGENGPREIKRRFLLGQISAGGSLVLAGCVGLFPEPVQDVPPTNSGDSDTGAETTDRTEAGATDERTEESDAGTGTESAAESDQDTDGATDAQTAEIFEIEYVKQEDTIDVPAAKSLLVAGEEQGWDLPFGCRQGYCGQCLGKIDGDVNTLVDMTTNEYEPLDQAAMAAGYTLTCTGHPRGDFTLETGKYGELDE